jgi:hypothetical protein
MALDDILYASTGSYGMPSLIVYLPVSGSTGSLSMIEAQTVYYEKRLFGSVKVSIF